MVRFASRFGGCNLILMGLCTMSSLALCSVLFIKTIRNSGGAQIANFGHTLSDFFLA